MSDEQQNYDYLEDDFVKLKRENAALRAQLAEQEKRLAAAAIVLHEIVCTEPPDDGVVLLSNDSPCHWDAEHKIDVYDHEHFSPLGDALMKLYRVLNGEGCEQLEMLLNAASGVCKSYPQRAIMRPYVKQLRKWFNDNPGWLPEPKKGA